jgi:hypothetical protein
MGFRYGILLVLTLAPGLEAADVAKPDAAAKKPEKASYTKQIAPLVAKYCVGCHGGNKPKAGLALDTFKDDASILKKRAVWEKVAMKLRTRQMPPRRRAQPTDAERGQITSWLDAELGTVDCNLKRDPGRVTIRRLNRAEYNNTIRDLVGVTFQPAAEFPADDVGYGFDNIGDVLSLPPLLAEKYLSAAEKIIAAAFKSPKLRKRILGAGASAKPNDKKDAARKVIAEFARRAFRRPVKAEEVKRFLTLVELAEKKGDATEQGIQLALQAILVSPHFLFRIETDKELNNPDGPKKATGPVILALPSPFSGPVILEVPSAYSYAIHPITEYELATRLSFFLWSSMPDEELFQQAAKGTLHKNIEAQVRRMLKDAKARALVENFAGQWLQLRNLQTVAPDPGVYPAFDDKLRHAMLTETELFFAAIMREDRSVLDFLDARFTFVNERLARHYGIDGIKGEQFRKIDLKDGARGGVLTQASILTLTSNPTRTSPVKRGKWILENILGTPPSPPPPDAGELSEDKEVVESGSLRKRMEMHRAKPRCAVCHESMDPLGFGFENFDGIGAWRTKDGKFDIDPSGALPGGQSFKGPAELKKILKGRQKDFCRCLGEKMLTYALGRGLEWYDKCAVDDVIRALAKEQYKFSALVIAIAKSEPFQLRRGKRGTK